MASKALNMKWDSDQLAEIKSVTAVYNMTMTEFFREAAEEELKRLKEDPFYRLTANVEEATPAESAEILEALSKLTDDDLQVASEHTFTIHERKE